LKHYGKDFYAQRYPSSALGAWAKLMDAKQGKVDESLPDNYTWADYLKDAALVYPFIMKDAGDEKVRLTEVFRSAPVWLLVFTQTFIDAKLLGFDLPDLSEAPKIRNQGALEWPLLSVGTMSDRILEPGLRSQETDLSVEEALFLVQTCKKPSWNWTLSERRRINELFARLGLNKTGEDKAHPFESRTENPIEDGEVPFENR
jgi:hypothetical protein